MKASFQAADPQPIPYQRTRRARAHTRPVRVVAVSILLAISWLGLAFFLGSAVALGWYSEQHFGYWALGGLFLFALGRAGSFILGRNLNCTLCHGPVLHEKRCHKHADAFRLAPLSYRTSTAVSVLCTAGFRCMYCGTAYRLKK